MCSCSADGSFDLVPIISLIKLHITRNLVEHLFENHPKFVFLTISHILKARPVHKIHSFTLDKYQRTTMLLIIVWIFCSDSVGESDQDR
jgi:hypothetical protein